MIDRQEVLRMFRETELTGVEIAKRLGVTNSFLPQVVQKETGLKPGEYRLQHGWIAGPRSGEGSHARLRPIPPSVIARIVSLHSTGEPTHHIAQVVGATAETVAHVLDVQDLQPNPLRFAGLPTTEIAARYVAGENAVELGLVFEVSERQIRRVLDAEGVQRRPKGRVPKI